MNKSNPLVSVGIPTYNRPKSLKKVLKSLLNQTYDNIEILISDNCSEGNQVDELIHDFLKNYKENKIRYFRQPKNMGAAFNYQFVLEKARGKYFFWNADDDIRSPDFVEVNTNFLESNLEYSAATSPNAMVSDFDKKERNFINFSIEGELLERYRTFFENALISQGIFYAQYRTDIIKDCPFLGKDFIATDWAISLYTLEHGPIARLKDRYILNLRGGVSESDNHFQNYRQNVVDDIIPMYRLYSETKELYRNLKFFQQVSIFSTIMRFNKIYYAMLYQ